MADAVTKARVERLEGISAEHDAKIAETWALLNRVIEMQAESVKDTREFKAEMRGFKDEMQEFKDRIDRWIADAERDRKEMNRKWGDLARKMGTLVEDIVAPGLPDAIASTFGLKVQDIMERRTKHLKDKTREYDVIAVADGKVFVVEVKSSLEIRDIDEALVALDEFFQFFPEFEDKRLVGVVSSLNVQEAVVNYATKHGLLVLGMGGDYLRFENADKIDI